MFAKTLHFGTISRNALASGFSHSFQQKPGASARRLVIAWQCPVKGTNKTGTGTLAGPFSKSFLEPVPVFPGVLNDLD
jgi:hypothetical protein